MTVRDHQGDYGIDGSFHTISARGQAIGVGAQAAALAVWAAVSLARGKRLTAAVTGTSAVGIAASAALYIYATRAGKFEVWNRIFDDLWETRQHAARLRERGWQKAQRRSVGWRMWYGGPWVSTRLVTATKPG